MVTPDLEYHYHVGSKPVKGPEGLGRFLDSYWSRYKDGVWHIDTFAQSGDKLLMEGWEELTEIASASASRTATWASWSFATARSRAGGITFS
jgi:hypothetical protein